MATYLDTPLGNVWQIRDVREIAKETFFKRKGFTQYINIEKGNIHAEYYDIPLHLDTKQLKDVAAIIKEANRRDNAPEMWWNEILCTKEIIVDSIEEYLFRNDMLRNIKNETKD